MITITSLWILAVALLVFFLARSALLAGPTWSPPPLSTLSL